jgi:hypothetical protein
MKKSELRQIIKEELSKAINEEQSQKFNWEGAGASTRKKPSEDELKEELINLIKLTPESKTILPKFKPYVFLEGYHFSDDHGGLSFSLYLTGYDYYGRTSIRFRINCDKDKTGKFSNKYFIDYFPPSSSPQYPITKEIKIPIKFQGMSNLTPEMIKNILKKAKPMLNSAINTWIIKWGMKRDAQYAYFKDKVDSIWV